MRGRSEDGWEDEFIRALGVTGQVVPAARAAGISPSTAYARRATKPPFAQRWETAKRAPHLHKRLLEVLELIAQGLTNPEIAARLYLSLSGVQTRVRTLFRELDVHSRLESVERARALGILAFGVVTEPNGRRWSLHLCEVHGILPRQWARDEMCVRCAQDGRHRVVEVVDVAEIVQP